MKPTFLILGVVLLALLTACTAPQEASKDAPSVMLATPSGKVDVTVELAENVDQWARGLAGRETLAEGNGMLFITPDEQPRTFWMKDTKIPLDVIFFNKNFEIVDIKENFQPCTENCELYTAKTNAQYILEVNAGFAQKNKIAVGQKATFTRP